MNLVNNCLESLEPLAGLGAILILKVSHNQVHSLAPLRHLAALEELWVHQNRVADKVVRTAEGDLAREARHGDRNGGRKGAEPNIRVREAYHADSASRIQIVQGKGEGGGGSTGTRVWPAPRARPD